MSEGSEWTRKELEDQINSMSAVTIPVNMRIEGKQRIFALTEMERILKDAKLIALGECGCRKRLKKCDKPLDVCITLDKSAEEGTKKGFSRIVGLEEALETLKRSHKAGLVHISYTIEGKQKPDLICSCCSCCCQSLSALIRFGMPNAVATSKYVAQDDPEKCANCGKCVERCQFRARHMEDGKKIFDKNRCFGCGLCQTSCPTKTISLMARA